MDERSEVLNIAAALAVNVDARRWEALLELFAPEVLTDYTSLFGGTPQRQPREKLVGGWAAFLPGFTRTQHMIGAALVEVEGDRASLAAPVVAWHFCKDPVPGGGDTWLVGGRYEMQMVRSADKWRITHLTLAAAWAEGNLDLPRIAGERAAALERRG